MDHPVGTVVLWVARIAVAGVFATAAVAKFRDRPAAVQGTQDLGVPAGLVGGVSMVVPVLEAVASLAILIPSLSAIGAALGLTLLCLFTVAVVLRLRAGEAPLCFCFGNSRAAPIGIDTVVRNAALGVLCIAVVLGSRS